MKTYELHGVEKNGHLRIAISENGKNWLDWYKPVYKYSIDEIITYLRDNEIPIINSNCRYYEIKEEDYRKIAESIIDDIGDDDIDVYVKRYIDKNGDFDIT